MNFENSKSYLRDFARTSYYHPILQDWRDATLSDDLTPFLPRVEELLKKPQKAIFHVWLWHVKLEIILLKDRSEKEEEETVEDLFLSLGITKEEWAELYPYVVSRNITILPDGVDRPSITMIHVPIHLRKRLAETVRVGSYYIPKRQSPAAIRKRDREIFRLYKNGSTLREIREQVNLANSTIYRLLRNYTGERLKRKLGTPPPVKEFTKEYAISLGFSEEEYKEILAVLLYKTRWVHEKTAIRFLTKETQSKFVALCKRQHLYFPSPRRCAVKKRNEAIKEDFREGVSQEHMLKKYKISKTTLNRILRKR